MRDRERKILGQTLATEPTPPDATDTLPDESRSPLLVPHDAAVDASHEPFAGAPSREALAHPLVWLDPVALTWAGIRSLRQRAVPMHVFHDDALEPAAYARGVTRHRLAGLDEQPARWQARLLEFAAWIEPRPVLIPCSGRARALLHEARETLAPHFEFAPVDALEIHRAGAAESRTESALRRCLVRGEPAFDVQITLDDRGRCNGACVLTWVAGVPPHVVVTSVEGHEVLERSLEWLRTRRVRGYARLVWAPDRFGRIDLLAAGTLPGSSWVLAAEDGVDFPWMEYACLARIPVPAQFARRGLSRSLRIGKLDARAPTRGLLPAPKPAWSEDPLVRLMTWARSWKR